VGIEVIIIVIINILIVVFSIKKYIKMKIDRDSSNNLYKNLVENINEIIFTLDKDGNFTYISPAIERSGTYKTKELIGKNFIEVLHKDDAPLVLCGREKVLNDRGEPTEYRIVDKSGKPIWVRGSSRPIYKNGKIVGITGVITDITDRIHAEKKLKKSLDEKETLIKEIHHRVKNNLSVISSLILLQTNRMTDSPERLILMDCLSRIKSMALIHEKLYKSKSLSDIDIEDHIRTLVAQLYLLYNIRKINIDFEIDIENIRLDINMAVPVTLILNELIINAIEHAFVGRESGKVCIIFKQDGNFYEMVVQDNGVGFPKNIDIYNTDTLGLQLVTNLAIQLKDDIEISNGNGTKFKLRFPKGNNNND